MSLFDLFSIIKGIVSLDDCFFGDFASEIFSLSDSLYQYVDSTLCSPWVRIPCS